MRKIVYDVDRFVELWKANVKAKEVGVVFGTTGCWVNQQARKLGLPKRGLYRRKVDYEEFRRLWNEGESSKDIAEHFKICEGYVGKLRAKLKLQRRRPSYPYWLVDRLKQRRQVNKQKVIEFLEEKGGFCGANEAKEIAHNTVVNMVARGEVLKVDMDLGRSSGKFNRTLWDKIFKPDFGLKTFVCLGRTGLVRLMQQALQQPKDRATRVTVTVFLRNNHLSQAEQIAVLWYLGIRKWEKQSVKQSIQVDGVRMPNRNYLARKYLEGKSSAMPIQR